MIPTKRVRRLADDAEAIINAEDFDPALYEDLDAAPPKTQPTDLIARHEELFGSKPPPNMKPENLAEVKRREEEAAKKAAETGQGGGQQ